MPMLMSVLHSVIPGWFGLSALWLLVPVWRVIRAVLPGGAGLRGIGMRRLWAGFALALLASCTFEAICFPVTGINAVGHAIHGALLKWGLRDGMALLALCIVFVAGLPWLLGGRWRALVAWAGSQLGLGAQRDAASSGASRRFGGAGSTSYPASYSMGPIGENRHTIAGHSLSGKRRGRWQRPTSWQPPAKRPSRSPAVPAATNIPPGALPLPAGEPRAQSIVRPSPRAAQPAVVRRPALSASSAPSVARFLRRPGMPAPAAPAPVSLSTAPPSSPQDHPDEAPMDDAAMLATLRAINQNAARWTTLAAAPVIPPTPQPAPPPPAPPPPAPMPVPTPVPAPVPVPTPSPPPQDPRPASANFVFHPPVASSVTLPRLDLLEAADTNIEPISDEKLAATGHLIEQRLQEFKVPVTVVGASAGPVITRFEIEPAQGVRGSQIVGLMKDLSRGLRLTSIRVVETIPGKTCMGLELPNPRRQIIRLSEILTSPQWQRSPSKLTLALGKDIVGQPVVTDLAKAPHMLVAGTTGSGKSVAINAMILSLLYKATPEQVRLLMIDPKMLELSAYEGIAHLLAPVVTDMKLAANALHWCVGEMEKRYRLMSAVGVRNLAGFNQKIREANARGVKIGNPFSLTPDAPEPLAALPMIVVVIDELADLMMVAGKKVEELIARLAQKARAAGIHLILATQRPSVDVITGLIKANIPTRIAFQVSSKIDSRTILDQMGAETLLGMGDMLFLPPGTGYPQRIHGAFVADAEVHHVVEYLKQFGAPEYVDGILDSPQADSQPDLFGDAGDAEADPLYDEAVAFVVRTRRASISSVQRQLRIGYNRAARLVEQMEAAGLVSPMSINGSREVIVPAPE